MIEVKNLTKQYGAVNAVDNVSFTVNKGEILGFLGPNGAGKTTTMRMLTCFLQPTSGSISIAGFDSRKSSIEVRKRIGYLPENPPLYDDMTVNAYLSFVAEIKNIPRKLCKEKTEKVMEMCGLKDIRRRIIGNISKGYRQRVGLAQALVHNPPVLILDEPTVGLDPRQIAEIRQLIKNLSGERTIILSTHILPEVSMTCQRVAIINKGRIVAEDSYEKLSKQLSGTDRIFISIEGMTDSESAVSELSGIESVISVTPEEGGFIIEFEKNSESRKKIAPFVVGKGWDLLEMKNIEFSLEEVFVELTTEEVEMS